jgi:uncharacterized membrane protein YesL
MAITTTESGQVIRRSKAPVVGQRKIFNHELYETAFGTLYLGLATNVLLAVFTLPILALTLTVNPLAAWPLMTLALPLLAPAFAAVFSLFSAYSSDKSTPVVRTLLRSWVRHAPRSLAIGLAASVIVTMTVLNTIWLRGEALGAVAIPIQLAIAAVVVVTALYAMVLLPELPGARLIDVLKASVLIGMRRLWATIPSLIVLGLLMQLTLTRPAVALGFAAAPMLFGVWGVCRYAARPALPATEDPSAD